MTTNRNHISPGLLPLRTMDSAWKWAVLAQHQYRAPVDDRRASTLCVRNIRLLHWQGEFWSILLSDAI